jgi:hypothetical protein
MSDKLYKIILQALALITFIFLACTNKLTEDSILVLSSTIIGYAFSLSKDYIGKDNAGNKENDTNKK